MAGFMNIVLKFLVDHLDKVGLIYKRDIGSFLSYKVGKGHKTTLPPSKSHVTTCKSHHLQLGVTGILVSGRALCMGVEVRVVATDNNYLTHELCRQTQKLIDWPTG